MQYATSYNTCTVLLPNLEFQPTKWVQYYVMRRGISYCFIITTAPAFAFLMHYRMFSCLNLSSQSSGRPPGMLLGSCKPHCGYLHIRTTGPVQPIFISRLIQVR